MGTVVVLVALLIGGGVLRGAGDSRTPMTVTAIANLLNVALAYGLIYGHFGLPALGVIGSAWATFVARVVALLLMLRALWAGRGGVSIAGGGGWRPNWSVARRVLGLGIPAAVEQVLITTAFLFLTILVARLGTDTLAAQRISMSALSFSFLPGIGFGIAATAAGGPEHRRAPAARWRADDQGGHHLGGDLDERDRRAAVRLCDADHARVHHRCPM